MPSSPSSNNDFELTLVLSKGPNDSHYKMLKVLNPSLEMWVVEGCQVCQTVKQFFLDQGVKLKVMKVSSRSLEPEEKPTKSKAKSTKYPIVQYAHERNLYPVPLPKIHDGAAEETLRKRLRDAFKTKTVKLREHQVDLLNAFEKKDLNERHAPAFLVFWEMGSGKTLGATSLLMYKRSLRNIVVCNNSNIGYWVDHISKTPFNVGQRPSEKNHRKRSTMALKKTKAMQREDESESGDSSGSSGSSGSSSSGDEGSSDSDSSESEEEEEDEEEEVDRADEDNLAILFEVVGYTAFRASFDSPSSLRHYSSVVLDEAHYFRNHTANMRSAVAALHGAKNVIQLTGTWLVNDVGDVQGMVELTDMDGVFKRKNTQLTPAELTKFMEGNVSWFDPRVHRPKMFAKFYPKVQESIVKVPMTFPQTLEYLMALRSIFTLGPYTVQQGKTNRYNCQTRAVCNAPGADALNSPKLRAVLDNIKSRLGKGPQVVHSSLVDTGVSALEKIFKAENLEARRALITGSTPNEEREKIRQAYNKGKIDILSITDACQFGMDLSGTFAMHAVEQAKNKSSENQTKARVIRMGSHKNAAFDTVQYIKYISVFPTRKPTEKDLRDCEEYLIGVDALGKRTAELLGDIDLAAEILAKIKEEKGVTINERQENDNETKQAEINPYLAALRQATVYMSTQKDTKMFDEDQELSSSAGVGDECDAGVTDMDTGVEDGSTQKGTKKSGKKASVGETITVAKRKKKEEEVDVSKEGDPRPVKKKARKQNVSEKGKKLSSAEDEEDDLSGRGFESYKPKYGASKAEAGCGCDGEDASEMSDAEAFQTFMGAAAFESFFPAKKVPKTGMNSGRAKSSENKSTGKTKRRSSVRN